jgi:hypothetical protein
VGQTGKVSSHSPCVGSPRKIAPFLLDADSEVPACQPADARVRQQRRNVGGVHVPSPVALARQRQDRVRTGADLSGDVARQVNTEERQTSVGNRVDGSPHLIGDT